MVKYQPVLQENDFLFLRRKEAVGPIEELLKLTGEKHTFGESVTLPYSSQPIFAQIEIRPTILGRIASVFWKPSQLQITLELKNGTKKQYRIVAGMAKSTFMISPLIEKTADFGMLYGKNAFLAGKLVKSISIGARDVRSKLWNEEYNVTFSQTRNTSPIDISNIYRFDAVDDELSGYKVMTAQKCDGSIDAINHTSPVPEKLSASNVLTVSGWVAASVDRAILPEAVYAVLTDAHGSHRFFRTHRTPRLDVGGAFRKPELNESGFAAMLDVSALEGKYTLGLGIRLSGKVEICPQFEIPVTIAN
jgi:hypothetical protein